MPRLPFIPILLVLLVVSCTSKPYAPPPQKARVDGLEVILHNFQGRLEAYALVQGRLSSSVAQLVDAEQYREGNILFVDVLEQTPRGALGELSVTGPPPFQTRIPIEILGLRPGEYIVHANGIESTLEIPRSIEAIASYDGFQVPGAEATPVIPPVPRSAISDAVGTGFPASSPPPPDQGEATREQGESPDSGVVTGA